MLTKYKYIDEKYHTQIIEEFDRLTSEVELTFFGKFKEENVSFPIRNLINIQSHKSYIVGVIEHTIPLWVKNKLDEIFEAACMNVYNKNEILKQ